jgi:hypothetical protein
MNLSAAAKAAVQAGQTTRKYLVHPKATPTFLAKIA